MGVSAWSGVGVEWGGLVVVVVVVCVCVCVCVWGGGGGGGGGQCLDVGAKWSNIFQKS